MKCMKEIISVYFIAIALSKIMVYIVFQSIKADDF